jgi:SAM-dependent methyltransferase
MYGRLSRTLVETAARRQMTANRHRWDESVPFHLQSPLYDMAAFRRGRNTITSIEREEAGSVRGRSLLHLQCHFGQDTISWARLGAHVTGVDFSPSAIAAARQLAEEVGTPARFVESNVYELPRHLRGRFDVVYTGRGALIWLPDLERWAKVVARYLRPGGRFVMLDDHPISDICRSGPGARRLELERSYFSRAPLRWVGDGTYATSARLRHRVSYEWTHPLGDLLSALIRAGLRIERVREFPYSYWHKFPFLRQRADGYWALRSRGAQIPLMYSVRARR